MHPNEALARREIDLIAAGDLEALEAPLSDLSSTTPAETPCRALPGSAVSGEVRGAARGRDAPARAYDALGTDDHAVQLLHVTAGGRTFPFLERGRSAARAGRQVLRMLDSR